jgi:hypothetical protein
VLHVKECTVLYLLYCAIERRSPTVPYIYVDDFRFSYAVIILAIIGIIPSVGSVLTPSRYTYSRKKE